MSQCQPRPRAKLQRRPVTGALLNSACPASSPTAHTLLQLCRSAWAPHPFNRHWMALAACQALGRHRRQSIAFIYPVELLGKWADTDTDTQINYTVGNERARINQGTGDSHRASTLFGLLPKLLLLPVSSASLTVSSANTLSPAHTVTLPDSLAKLLLHSVSWGSKQMERVVDGLSGNWVSGPMISTHWFLHLRNLRTWKDTGTKETPV